MKKGGEETIYKITLTENEHELLVCSLNEYLTHLGDADEIRELVPLIEKIDNRCEKFENPA